MSNTTKSTQKVRVAVIGAGMAGLGAAYELSKDPRFEITVFEERDRVGGRVHTVNVEGEPVDFGGFIVYPWYEQFLRIVEELQLEELMEPFPKEEIYFQIDESGTYYTYDDVPIPKVDSVLMTMKMAKAVLQARDVAEPPLDAFDRLTAAEYYRKVLQRPVHAGMYEIISDVYMQGFCYPPVTEFKMSFMSPFLFNTSLRGSIDRSVYIPSGNAHVPNAIAAAIAKREVVIRTGTPVTGFAPGVLTVAGKAEKFDEIVFAQDIDAELYSAALPGVQIDSRYTHFYTAAVRFTAQPTIPHATQNWKAIFYLPDTSKLQVTSAVNLELLYGANLSGIINLNIVVRDDRAEMSEQELFNALQSELQRLFPNQTAVEIVTQVHWQKTMPVVTEEFVEQVRKAQGINNTWFAGDYLGAPSMETALATGARAAEAIKQRYEMSA